MLATELLAVGQPVKIKSFGQMDKTLRARLYGLGFYLGAVIELAYIAPLGCPIAIRVGSSLVSLRKKELESLVLEAI